MAPAGGSDGNARDTDPGGYSSYSDEDFLAALEEIGPAGTSDVAEVVGCSDRTAYNRLMELADEARVRFKRINGRTILWLTV